MGYVNKKDLLFLIVFLIGLFSFSQNQTINYSTNAYRYININFFDVSKALL
jgi:hypothetical protein